MTYLKVKKIKMSQIFKDTKVIPVTLVEVIEKKAELDLKIGDLLKVIGISKGKGFQGVVKRHGFSGGPKTHGQKNRLRAPGSIGPTAPQRVLPGRKMAGRTGGRQVTLKTVGLVEVDEKNSILSLKGAVPGRRGSILKISLNTRS